MWLRWRALSLRPAPRDVADLPTVVGGRSLVSAREHDAKRCPAGSCSRAESLPIEIDQHLLYDLFVVAHLKRFLVGDLGFVFSIELGQCRAAGEVVLRRDRRFGVDEGLVRFPCFDCAVVALCQDLMLNVPQAPRR